MSISIQTSDELLAALRRHPEWREAIQREILTEELLALPARFERAEIERKEDSRKVWEAIGELTDRVSRLGEAQERTEASFRAFLEATERRAAEIDGRLDSLESTLRSFMEATERRAAEVDGRLDSLESTLRSFMEATERRAAEVDGRLDSLESTLRSFMEATERRAAEVDGRLDSLESTLRSFMEATERRAAEVDRQIDQIVNKLNELDGGRIEVKAMRSLGSYLSDYLSRVRELSHDEMNLTADIARDAGAITREERVQLSASDALLVGRDRRTREPVCVAVEVSRTVDRHDVDRAEKRAELFLKASRAAVRAEPSEMRTLFSAEPAKAISLVVGKVIPDQIRQEAERRGVLLAKFHNGYELDLS
ncbi:MAG: hypothetical protein AB7T14_04770 [Candidatus Methylacidiphilaceae bacterium]